MSIQFFLHDYGENLQMNLDKKTKRGCKKKMRTYYDNQAQKS